MRAKALILLAASAALLHGAAAMAAEKPGKPLNVKPPVAAQPSDSWRDRAMKARAEFAPEGAPPRGTARARDERGDRRDGEEVGSGRLRQDTGEGSDPGE